MRRHRTKLVTGLIVIAAFAFFQACIFFGVFGSSADPVYVDRLKNAQHLPAAGSAGSRTLALAKRDLKVGALNAIGRELREVSAMTNGNPRIVFAMLSYLGGYGEMIWVDDWPNFTVKLQGVNTGRPGFEAPRNEVVEAALKAIDDAGGVLLWAGPGRHLVVRKEERRKFEAALQELGWRRGVSPFLGGP